MKKKAKELTASDVENKIIRLISQVAGETTLEEVEKLLYKFGELKFDEGKKYGEETYDENRL